MFGIAVAFAKWVLRDYLEGLEQLKSHYKEADRESSKNFANAVMEIRNLQTDLSLMESSKGDLLDMLDGRNKTIDALRSAVEDHQKELEELRRTVVQQEEMSQLRINEIRVLTNDNVKLLHATNAGHKLVEEQQKELKELQKTVVRQKEISQLQINEIGVLTKDFDSMSKALTAAQSLVEEQQKTVDKLNGLLAKRDAVIGELRKEKASAEDRLKNLCKAVDSQIGAIRFSVDAAKMCNRKQPENETCDVRVGDWIEFKGRGDQWKRASGTVTAVSGGYVFWVTESGIKTKQRISEVRKADPPENTNRPGDVQIGDWIEYRFSGNWVRSQGPVTEIKNGEAWWEHGPRDFRRRHAWKLSECRRTTPPETSGESAVT